MAGQILRTKGRPCVHFASRGALERFAAQVRATPIPGDHPVPQAEAETIANFVFHMVPPVFQPRGTSHFWRELFLPAPGRNTAQDLFYSPGIGNSKKIRKCRGFGTTEGHYFWRNRLVTCKRLL